MSLFRTTTSLILGLAAVGCSLSSDATGSSEQGVSSSTTIVASHSGKCVDVRAHSTANGGVIEQWACNGGANQSFSLVATDSGYSMIKNDLSGLCLNVDGRSLVPGGTIIQWTCGVAAKNDQWKPIANDDGTYSLAGRESGLCLEVPGSSTADGVQVDQSSCSGAANQRFTMELDSSPPPPPSSFRVMQWNVEDGEQAGEITEVVSQKPQIAFLEEVDRVQHIADIASALSADQGVTFYEQSVNRDGSASGASNVGILSRYPLSNVHTKVLATEGEVICGVSTAARAAIGATITIDSKPLAIIAVRTYFDSTSCVSETQIGRLKAWATATYPGMTMLIGGDFNMSPGSSAYVSATTDAPALTDSWYEAVLAKTATAHTTVSFTTPTRSSRLDYLFYDNASATTLAVKDANIPPLTPYSDHRPMITDFTSE
ncbi:MAG TPA: RICIN domain-containing protein [Polyangiaceae bacterium]|jgi:endonuclease/exonuclease/phosphatase family metal-dependent hydrolase